MSQNMSKDELQKPFKEAAPEIRQIIKRVLDAEKNKLHMKNPRNIKEDLKAIFEEEIK